MRRFHNGADATLVPTRELADYLETQGFRQVVHLARAVNARQFNPGNRDAVLRRSWGLGEEGLAVIYLGRIAPEKNLELAIAIARVPDDIRGFGHVKDAALQAAKVKEAELWSGWPEGKLPAPKTTLIAAE